MDMHIKIGPEEASSILDNLPGGPDLYRECAKTFVEHYRGPSVVIHHG